jgi:hypothetical protein
MRVRGRIQGTHVVYRRHEVLMRGKVRLTDSNGKTCSEAGHMANCFVQSRSPMIQHPNGKGPKLPVHFRAAKGAQWLGHMRHSYDQTKLTG